MKKCWIIIAIASATLMTSCGFTKSPEQNAVEAVQRQLKEYDDAMNKRLQNAENLIDQMKGLE